jgi:hypothetical protein
MPTTDFSPIVAPTPDVDTVNIDAPREDGTEPAIEHRVSALYPNLARANEVKEDLLLHFFSPQAIEIRQPQATDVATEVASAEDNDEVIKEVLVGSAIGAALGVGAGAIGTVVLITASVTLFIASPIIAPIALMANLATVGGLLGGAFGAADKDTQFSTVLSNIAGTNAESV